MEQTNAQTPPRTLTSGQKQAIDFAPLLVFFITNAVWGLMPATGAIMAATAVAIAISWFYARHIPVMPLVSAILLMIFGGLTLVFDNDIFIKMKPTIVYVMMATALGVGLITGRNFMGRVLGGVFTLTDRGWHIMTMRWIGFFLFAACLNEAVWRTQTTDIWVSFKVFGFLPLTFVFAALQAPLLNRYSIKAEDHD